MGIEIPKWEDLPEVDRHRLVGIGETFEGGDPMLAEEMYGTIRHLLKNPGRAYKKIDLPTGEELREKFGAEIDKMLKNE